MAPLPPLLDHYALLLSWLAQHSRLSLLALTMVAAGVLACVTILGFGVRTPYGRYSRAGWGPTMPARFAWVLQEAPTPILVLMALAVRDEKTLRWSLSPSEVAHCLLALHYVHRAFIYPLQIQNGKPTPVTIAAMAFAFCLYNGAMQSAMLVHQLDDVTWAPLTVFGLVLMVYGALENVRADTVLRSLRRNAPPNAPRYRTPPSVGLFQFVSGANFLGEILEWCGYSALCGLHLPAVAFAAFTALNIGPRAIHHHAFYLQKLDGYSKLGRRALIPFLL